MSYEPTGISQEEALTDKHGTDYDAYIARCLAVQPGTPAEFAVKGLAEAGSHDLVLFQEGITDLDVIIRIVETAMASKDKQFAELQEIFDSLLERKDVKIAHYKAERDRLWKVLETMADDYGWECNHRTQAYNTLHQ